MVLSRHTLKGPGASEVCREVVFQGVDCEGLVADGGSEGGGISRSAAYIW